MNGKKIIQRLLYGLRIYHFYQEQKHPQTTFAVILDHILLASLIFSAIYLWIVQKTKRPFSALLLAVLLAVLIYLCIVLWKRKRFLSLRNIQRRQISREYLKNQLYQMDAEEFKWQLMKILLNIKGFHEIKDHGCFIEASFYRDRIAIGFSHSPYKEYTLPHELHAFMKIIANMNFQKALYISLAPFKESCRQMADQKHGISVELVDDSMLIDMFEKAGCMPDDKAIDKYINMEMQKRLDSGKEVQNKIFTPQKIKTYLLFSVIFFTASFFIKGLGLYYFLISIALLIISILTYLVNPKKENEQSLTEMIISESSEQT